MKKNYFHKVIKLALLIIFIILFLDMKNSDAYVGDYQTIAYLQDLLKKRLPDISYNQNTKKYLVVGRH